MMNSRFIKSINKNILKRAIIGIAICIINIIMLVTIRGIENKNAHIGVIMVSSVLLIYMIYSIIVLIRSMVMSLKDTDKKWDDLEEKLGITDKSI